MVEPARAVGRALLDNVGRVFLGKPDALRVVVAAALAGGHVLIDDVPGVGKTLLAKALARSIDASFARIQGSADLLPSDITGVSVFDPRVVSWEFRPGPVFHHVVLFDEINRATPRAQAALLEAMAERHVTVDGATRPLPVPFLVLATQNPAGELGTFPLLLGQRDRFTVSVSLGFPERSLERALLAGEGGEPALAELGPVVDVADLSAAEASLAKTHLSAPVIEYLLDVIACTRTHPDVLSGASTRAAAVLARMSRAWAALDGRNYVLPADVKAMAPSVLTHRLIWRGAPTPVAEMIRAVAVPVP